MSPIVMLLILAGVLMALLTVLLIYRNTLEMHEDDQLFLDDAESAMAKEQEELQVKLNKIEPMVRWVGAAMGLCLLIAAGMWIYGGIMSTNLPH